MIPESRDTNKNRRHFLGQVIQLGCLACLNPFKLCSAVASEKNPSDNHKFKDDSQMSFEQVYGFVYSNVLIPNLHSIAKQIGKEQLIEILKKGNEERSNEGGRQLAAKTNKHDLDSYYGWVRNPDRFWQHVVSFSIVEDTPKALELKVTECLWAKTFREAKAEDFGYVITCHGDYAHATGFSPNIQLIRTKTLMQGNECCNHRYVLNE